MTKGRAQSDVVHADGVCLMERMALQTEPNTRLFPCPTSWRLPHLCADPSLQRGGCRRRGAGLPRGHAAARRIRAALPGGRRDGALGGGSLPAAACLAGTGGRAARGTPSPLTMQHASGRRRAAGSFAAYVTGVYAYTPHACRPTDPKSIRTPLCKTRRLNFGRAIQNVVIGVFKWNDVSIPRIE